MHVLSVFFFMDAKKFQCADVICTYILTIYIDLCLCRGFDEAAKILLDAGADMHLLNSHKVTPFIMAAMKDNRNVLKVMVDHSNGQALCYQVSPVLWKSRSAGLLVHVHLYN